MSETSTDLRAVIERTNNDILAALGRLAAELPPGIVISDVDIDTLDAGRTDGKPARYFRVKISLEV